MPTTDLRVTQAVVEQITILRPDINVTQAVIEYISSLGVVCNNPPAGVVDVAYTHTFLAGSGDPPYTFTISAGFTPGGLALDPLTGVLSGIPFAAGLSAFTVQVLDSFGATATVECSINITLPSGDPSAGTIIFYGYRLVLKDPCAELVGAPIIAEVKRVL